MQNLDEKVDFSYFIKLALSKNISWNVLAIHFDESTTTLEKSKELNNVLIEEMKKLQTKIEELLIQRKSNNDVISNYQIQERIEDEECESMSEVSDRNSEIIELNFLNSTQFEQKVEKTESSEDLEYNLVQVPNHSKNLLKTDNLCNNDTEHLEDTLEDKDLEKGVSEDIDTALMMKNLKICAKKNHIHVQFAQVSSIKLVITNFI